MFPELLCQCLWIVLEVYATIGIKVEDSASSMVKILLTLRKISGQDFKNRPEDVLKVLNRICKERGKGYADVASFYVEPGRHSHPLYISCDFPEFLTDIGRTRFDRIYNKMLRRLLKDVTKLGFDEIHNILYRLETFFTFCKHNKLNGEIARRLVQKLSLIIEYYEVSENGLYLMVPRRESSCGDYEEYYSDSDYSPYDRRHEEDYWQEYGYTFEDMVDDARMAMKYGM